MTEEKADPQVRAEQAAKAAEDARDDAVKAAELASSAAHRLSDKEQWQLEALHMSMSVHDVTAHLAWDRFNAMLVSNSIVGVLVAVGFEGSALNQTVVIAASVFGVVLSVIWFALIRRGQRMMDWWQWRIAKFPLGPENNPMADYLDWRQGKDRSKDEPGSHWPPSTRQLAQIIVGMYLLGYVAVILYVLMFPGASTLTVP